MVCERQRECAAGRRADDDDLVADRGANAQGLDAVGQPVLGAYFVHRQAGVAVAGQPGEDQVGAQRVGHPVGDRADFLRRGRKALRTAQEDPQAGSGLLDGRRVRR